MTELARNEIKVDRIELPGERTKNGLPHTILITPMIRRVLDSLPSTGKWLLEYISQILTTKKAAAA
jgi:hypothetical protein